MSDTPECPRCGLPAKYLAADHLDRCGEAGDGFPADRWRGRDYLGRSAAQQAEMRRVEVAEVLKRGCPPVAPSAANSVEAADA